MKTTIRTMAAFAGLALLVDGAGAQGAPQVLEPLIPAAGTVLDVVAQGRTTRTPDLATIRAGVVTQSATAAQAMRDNAERMTRVVARLRRAGVAARDLQTAQIGLSPQYRYAENQPPAITGYQATNSLTVRFRDVARSGSILDALVAEGANQIDGPTLTIDQPDAALDEARTDAVARARARADLYARAAGMRVARIVSIAEAGEQAGGPRPPVIYAMARAMDSQAKTEVAAGEAEVTATLSVRFLLR
jgi:hypothetical protein